MLNTKWFKKLKSLPVYFGLIFGFILLSLENGYAQYQAQMLSSTSVPDLQVTEMQYYPSQCTMYFRVFNKGAASNQFNLWVGYHSTTAVSPTALAVPAMGANSYAWASQSRWISVNGQKVCGMNYVTKVQTYANPRYMYRYYNGAYMVGGILAAGAYAPSGWYVAEPKVSETNKTNNELTLPISGVKYVYSY